MSLRPQHKATMRINAKQRFKKSISLAILHEYVHVHVCTRLERKRVLTPLLPSISLIVFPSFTGHDYLLHLFLLQKVLGTRDLVSLGVGSCVGTGMYLVSGMVAKKIAGPAVVLSYAIAGVAALLSGENKAWPVLRIPALCSGSFPQKDVPIVLLARADYSPAHARHGQAHF